jgi:hypothetical protein
MQRGLLGVLATVLVLVGAGCRQSEPEMVELEIPDGVADQLVAMCDGLAAAKTLSYEASELMDVPGPGGHVYQRSAHFKVWFDRAGERVRIDVSSDKGKSAWVIGGGKATAYSAEKNMVGRSDDVPPTIIEALRALSKRTGVPVPGQGLLQPDPLSALLGRVDTVTLIGPATVAGVACQQVAFSEADSNWQLWMSTEAQPLPQQLLYNHFTGTQDMSYEVAFTGWTLDAPIDDALFTLEVPATATEVPLSEMLPPEEIK